MDDRRRVLLKWRHRFITDAWGWEIPIGGSRDGEEPAAAAARDHIFWVDGAIHIGPPAEGWEAQRIEWVPLADIRGLVESREDRQWNQHGRPPPRSLRSSKAFPHRSTGRI
ncbi:NUDIX hydrolase [Actinomadura sp. GC306]|uniref:NUDIX hydrolase n=1 Tax=Actinomadura sp. GC306 TaxID=2530367 RepID=UPI001FB5AD79|nr:NUDIX hydrolase [Actinomadura sp. GC306]